MSLGHELIQRKVLHYTGAYIGVAWAAVEFVNFTEERYLLSPYLTDLLLAVLTLMLPSVLIIAFFHGRRGADRVTRLERIAVPTNIVLAAVVLFVGFSGKDLGAMSTRVKIQDETGKTVERTVPKQAFRKRLALFRFDAPAGDALADTLAIAFPAALAADLRQDLFADVYFGHWAFRNTLRSAGFADGRNVPLTLKRQLSQKLLVQNFVSGRLERDGATIRVTVTLSDVAHGATLHERTFTGSDFFALVDSATVQLKRDLELPARQLEGTDDLPVSDVTTRSPAAFRAYASARDVITQAGDWTTGLRLLKHAVQLDSTFAAAQWRLASAYQSNSEAAMATAAFDAALRYAYRLPEHARVDLKAAYYEHMGDAPKSIALRELRTRLVPDDKDALVSLGYSYGYAGRWAEAKATFQRALNLDTTDAQSIDNLAWVAVQVPDTAGAISYIKQYLAHSPTDAETLVRWWFELMQLGELALTRRLCDRALLVDPGNVAATSCLGELAASSGDWAAAESLHVKAFRASRTSAERASVYDLLHRTSLERGQYRRSLLYFDSAMEARKGVEGPFYVAWMRLWGAGLYAKLGQAQRALALADSFEAAGSNYYAGDAQYARAAVYLETGRLPDAERALGEATARMATSNPLSVAWVDSLRGNLLHERGQHEAAVKAYHNCVELYPISCDTRPASARCLRRLHRYAEARSELVSHLRRRPGSPDGNYQFGLLLLETGDTSAAMKHLERAAAAWINADPEFEAADSVRLKLAELKSRGRL